MKVKVITECVIDGTTRLPNDVVETTEETATALINDGLASAVADETTEVAPAAQEEVAAEVAPAAASEGSPKEGDVCDLGNGETGVLTTNGEGQLVCSPKPVDETTEVAAEPRIIEQADLDTNPILVELNAEVGDAIGIGKKAA